MLKRLSSLSQSLNEASDALTQNLAEVETALADLRLGVWASVTVSKGVELVKQNDGSSMTIHPRVDLAYGKKGRSWGLLLVTGHDEWWGEEEQMNVAFLRESARDSRMEAVEKLPELLKELERRATDQVKEVQTKAAEVRAIAAALTKVELV